MERYHVFQYFVFIFWSQRCRYMSMRRNKKIEKKDEDDGVFY